MTVIVNNGQTLTVTQFVWTGAFQRWSVAAGGLLDGTGTITGGFTLLTWERSPAVRWILSVNAATLTNQGTIFANNELLTVPPPSW